VTYRLHASVLIWWLLRMSLSHTDYWGEIPSFGGQIEITQRARLLFHYRAFSLFGISGAGSSAVPVGRTIEQVASIDNHQNQE
jgi:hypothetical protein